MPASAYGKWSLRKYQRSGCAASSQEVSILNFVSWLFAVNAILTNASEFRCGKIEPSKAAESGALRPIISPFNTAAIDCSGTVECFTYHLEPSNPLSSAPCHTNKALLLPGNF